MVTSGFEGAMLRDPQAPYQPGRHRGTLKVKSFETAEAHVIGHGERNLELVTGEGVRFSVASGLTDEDREDLARFVGQIVSYSFFPTAGHAAPRFPVFRGVRNSIDL
jgi:DNA ligase-1